MLPLLMVSETAQFQKERRARDLNPRRFPLPVFKTGALDRAMRRLQVVREVYRENAPDITTGVLLYWLDRWFSR